MVPAPSTATLSMRFKLVPTGMATSGIVRQGFRQWVREGSGTTRKGLQLPVTQTLTQISSLKRYLSAPQRQQRNFRVHSQSCGQGKRTQSAIYVQETSLAIS